MVGLPKPRRLDQPIPVSLENVVLAHHVCRRLKSKLISSVASR